jgi:hypothetical protein
MHLSNFKRIEFTCRVNINLFFIGPMIMLFLNWWDGLLLSLIMVNSSRFKFGHVIYFRCHGLNIYGFISSGELVTRNIRF